MSDESMWQAVHRMDAAADVARRSADRMEEAAQRIALLLEDGYGGNGLRLIEELEKANAASEVERAEAAAEINQLRLAEEGAKEAFGVIVQEKRDLEAKCKGLQQLLDGAHDIIRRNAKKANS